MRNEKLSELGYFERDTDISQEIEELKSLLQNYETLACLKVAVKDQISRYTKHLSKLDKNIHDVISGNIAELNKIEKVLNKIDEKI